jgi:hypothetical protein
MPEDERLPRHRNYDAASRGSPLGLFWFQTWAERVIFEHFEIRQNSGFVKNRRFQSCTALAGSPERPREIAVPLFSWGNQHAFGRPIESGTTGEDSIAKRMRRGASAPLFSDQPGPASFREAVTRYTMPPPSRFQDRTPG